MSTKVIPDLSAALTLASWLVFGQDTGQTDPNRSISDAIKAGKAGLKEHQMIHEARALLTKLLGMNWKILDFAPSDGHGSRRDHGLLMIAYYFLLLRAKLDFEIRVISVLNKSTMLCR